MVIVLKCERTLLFSNRRDFAAIGGVWSSARFSNSRRFEDSSVTLFCATSENSEWAIAIRMTAHLALSFHRYNEIRRVPLISRMSCKVPDDSIVVIRVRCASVVNLILASECFVMSHEYATAEGAERTRRVAPSDDGAQHLGEKFMTYFICYFLCKFRCLIFSRWYTTLCQYNAVVIS